MSIDPSSTFALGLWHAGECIIRAAGEHQRPTLMQVGRTCGLDGGLLGHGETAARATAPVPG